VPAAAEPDIRRRIGPLTAAGVRLAEIGNEFESEGWAVTLRRSTRLNCMTLQSPSPRGSGAVRRLRGARGRSPDADVGGVGLRPDVRRVKALADTAAARAVEHATFRQHRALASQGGGTSCRRVLRVELFTESVIHEMTRLAKEHDAINLARVSRLRSSSGCWPRRSCAASGLEPVRDRSPRACARPSRAKRPGSGIDADPGCASR
jgi:hypothetical protein